MTKRTPKGLGWIAGICLVATFLSLILLLPAASEAAASGDTYYTVTASSNDESMGTVQVFPSLYQNDAGQYLVGTTVTMEATPVSEHYELEKWSSPNGDGDVYGNTINVTIEEGKSYEGYVAHFRPKKYKIIVPDYESITVNGALPEYHTYGQTTDLPTPKSNTAYTFEKWVAKNAAGEIKGEYTAGKPLGAWEYTDTIYLFPVFKPNPYNVTCTDKTSSGELLGTVILENQPFGSTVSPASFPDAHYRGYYFLATLAENLKTFDVTANADTNATSVVRVYLPKTFKVIFENCDKPDEVFTYGTDLMIDIPQRVGYRFDKWIVKNYTAEGALYDQSFASEHPYDGNSLKIPANAYDHAEWTAETCDSEELAIVLEAVWKPIEYSISYEDDDGVKNRPHFNKFPTIREFDAEVILEAPIRPGYTFKGWKLKGSDNEPVMTMTFKTEASDLVVVACWEVNSYEVTLDKGAEDATAGTEKVTVTFDAAFPSVEQHPTREGYTFQGYYYHGEHQSMIPYYYYDVEQEAWVGEIWDLPAEGVVLYAKWSVNSYRVEFDSALYENAEITVNGTAYDPENPFTFDYDTVVTVVIKVKDGHKLVKFNGAAKSHTELFSESYTVKGDVVLSGVILQELATPEFTVNYRDELFFNNGGDGVLAGRYCLVCGEDAIYFTVDADGVITFEKDNSIDRKLSAKAYFGKKVQLILCGDGETVADSDPQAITVAARPTFPKENENETEKETFDRLFGLDTRGDSIQVLPKNDSYDLEYAYRMEKDGQSVPVWSGSPSFAGLKAGASYRIYVRIRATDTTPAGEMISVSVMTLSLEKRNEMRAKLRELLQDGDGALAKKLIDDADQQMIDLVSDGSTYEEELNEIYEYAKSRIGVERSKDRAIAELNRLHAEKLATEQYSEELGLPKLNELLTVGVQKVTDAVSETEVDRLVKETQAEFDAVLVSYIFNSDLLITVKNGLHKDYRLSFGAGNLVTVSSLVSNAIASEKILVAGNMMSLEEAVAEMKNKDVKAFYSVRLAHSDATAAKPAGPFTVRLLLPEELRDETGLLVGYYQNGLNQLTVLDTERQGDYLIFTADSIADFVILSDHTVDLRIALVALTLTVLAQLVALIFLLSRRRKSARGARVNGFALPAVLMSIRFFPDQMLTVVLGLGALAVVLQIVLLFVLLKSDVITKIRFAKHFHSPRDAEVAEEQTFPSEEASLLSEEEGDPLEAEAYSDYEENALPSEELTVELNDDFTEVEEPLLAEEDYDFVDAPAEDAGDDEIRF